jgi:hypothetical protein
MKSVGHDYGAFWRFWRYHFYHFRMIRKRRQPFNFQKNLRKKRKIKTRKKLW